MKMCGIYCLLFFVALPIASAGAAEGGAKHLLLDSRIIEKSEGVVLRLGKIEKDSRNPLFIEDKSWEVRFDNMYPNVIFDEEESLFKCWYSPFIIDEPTATADEETRRRMTYCQALPGRNREMGICYAVSRNGIEWDKPELGLCSIDDSTRNNILIREVHGSGVFQDSHDSDPLRRYKMLSLLEGKGMAACFSADGLKWSELIFCPEIAAVGDTHNNAFWDERLGRYVGFTRLWASESPERLVGRSESVDFLHWTAAKEVLRGLHQHLQTYAMPVFRYADVYLGLVMILNTKTDLVDCELAWSADTIQWNRICPGTPLIPRGPQGSRDSGCIYAAACPIVRNDGILVYYGGNDGPHCGWRKGSLCLARLRPDGFAGMEAQGDETGIIVTKPVECSGNRLRVTADAAGGSLRVGVLGADGLELESCRPVTANVTDHELEWNGDADAASLKGKRIQLRFEMKAATLYSFSFISEP